MFNKLAVKLKRCRMLWAAALALPLAVGLAAPAAAEPTFSWSEPVSVSPGVQASFHVRDVFENPGTNPRFTEVTFSAPSYLDSSNSGFPGDESRAFYVTVLTSAELSALPSPPSGSFTFTADVTMTNDEGETASGTISFLATYVATSPETPSSPGEPATTPAIVADLTISAPPGVLTIIPASSLFENAGTDPELTGANVSSAPLYIYPLFGVTEDGGRLAVRPLPSGKLNDMGAVPPFTAEVTVTMRNFEGQTASGTFKLVTTWTGR